MLDLRSERIVVTGAAGFLGRAVVAALQGRAVPPASIFTPDRREYDLLTQAGAVRLLSEAFDGRRPSLVIHCAGFVGGLGANRAMPARFFHDNLAMGLHLIEAARQTGLIEGAGTFIQVGTMCSYPAAAPQPYREEDLFSGFPDPDIAPYGVAKLALLQMLDAYRLQYGLRYAYLIPSNLYGPGDNLDPLFSHAAGSLIRRFVDAAAKDQREVVCWGSGSPLRDFLYVQDAAEGILRAAEVLGARPQAAAPGMFPINLASGQEVSIRALAEAIAPLAGFRGSIVWDTSKGDGVARRSLDISRARELLGWSPAVGLEAGLRRTIEWYRSAGQTR